MSVLRAALPELVIAAVTATATAVAGYVMAGGAGAAVVVLAAAAVALVVLRTLVPAGAGTADAAPGPGRPRQRASRSVAPTMTGYWQRRFSVSGGMAQLSSYETGLRRTLEHLLAARLAERHGINLYEEPAAAQRVFCGDGQDADLWSWVSPDHAPDPGAGRHGIPRRTLGRLLDRLEQL